MQTIRRHYLFQFVAQLRAFPKFQQSIAQVKLEPRIQIKNKALCFDGQKISGSIATNSGSDFEYKFRRAISPNSDYKYLTMTGTINHDIYSGLTYPKFSFNKYDGVSTWKNCTDFNALDAKSEGNQHNWGLYGSMKYVGAKIWLGFQQ